MASISVYGYDPEMLIDHDELYNEGISSESNVVEAHKLEAQSTSCPLLELPYELRAQIYSYVLPSTTRLTKYGAVWHRATAPMWSASRQLYNECIPIF